MKTLIVSTLVAIVIAGSGILMYNTSTNFPSRMLSPVENAWTTWKMTYGRTYGTSTEEAFRKSVFIQQYNFINESNSRPENTYTLGLNKFSDLTTEEFRSQYTGFNKGISNLIRPASSTKHTNASVNSADIASKVDWRDVAVTSIQDQGQCGSCWAFSAVAAMESASYNYSQTLTKLSEQQLVSCDTEQNHGCNGGSMNIAFEYAAQKGMYPESQYPYTAQNDACDTSNLYGPYVYKPTDHSVIYGYSVEDTKKAVMQQVVSVAIEADQDVFRNYKSGVINNSCGDYVNHGVVIVGYDSNYSENEFWIVKNSWGSSWGENGYVRISTSTILQHDGQCGILWSPSYPTGSA